MAELVYAPALGAGGAIHESPSLSACTEKISNKRRVEMIDASSLKNAEAVVLEPAEIFSFVICKMTYLVKKGE